MNIQQAKNYIKDSVRLYLKKDEAGDYRIPVRLQRPVFLVGAPGIGKTAIMEQIAQELGIAIVSYSMTHHTRQSALGLPFLIDREYDGQSYSVTEYTMSEIIASVYDAMEESGIKEGILFLDEINCVSETLAPSMLQFLQYKTFGRHHLPEGWIIVTAGNPTLYNRSAREFDIVTMDRLKVMEIEQDYEVFRTYARKSGVHPAILGFLESNREFFYHISTTAKGREYVTARGWEDLSNMLTLYEEEGLKIDEDLVSQYIRSDNITREFTAYYDLLGRYKRAYQPEEIVKGKASPDMTDKAFGASIDEQLALTGMLADIIISDMKKVMEEAKVLKDAAVVIRALKEVSGEMVYETALGMINEKKERMSRMKAAGALSFEDEKKIKRCCAFLREISEKAAGMENPFDVIKTRYEDEVAKMKEGALGCGERVSNVFDFVFSAFGEGAQMLVLVSEITANPDAAGFIAAFGCEPYHKYSESLLISKRMGMIADKIDKIDLANLDSKI